MNSVECDFCEKRYAGFWIRAWATAIDVFLLMAITMPLLFWIYGAEYFNPKTSGFIRGPADFLINYVLPTIAVLVLWKYKSATPGKMAVGATIVDARTGDHPTDRQLLIRYFAYIVSTLPFFMGFLWIAFDPKKQAWHDKLAGTTVVRKAWGSRRVALA